VSVALPLLRESLSQAAISNGEWVGRRPPAPPGVALEAAMLRDEAGHAASMNAPFLRLREPQSLNSVSLRVTTRASDVVDGNISVGDQAGCGGVLNHEALDNPASASAGEAADALRPHEIHARSTDQSFRLDSPDVPPPPATPALVDEQVHRPEKPGYARSASCSTTRPASRHLLHPAASHSGRAGLGDASSSASCCTSASTSLMPSRAPMRAARARNRYPAVLTATLPARSFIGVSPGGRPSVSLCGTALHGPVRM